MTDDDLLGYICFAILAVMGVFGYLRSVIEADTDLE